MLIDYGFPPSGEQPEQRKLSHIRYNNQLTTVKQYFTNTDAIQNTGVL